MGITEPYELRAKLRPQAVSKRVADCGLRPVAEDVALVVRDYETKRRAWFIGVLRCGRQHSCPVCDAQKKARRADEVDRLIGADELGRWQMVTLTLRHHRGESLLRVLSRLMRAFRKLRSRRLVRDIYDARVTASIRALEVTYGLSGWHPHIHLVLRTSEWTDSECAVFEALWCKLADAELGVGVVWSTPIENWASQRGRYIAKLGCEVAGIAKEGDIASKKGLTQWQLAQAALTDDFYAARWREYQQTMPGRRILEMDERAKALLARAPDPEKMLREWTIGIYREQFAAIAALERHVPTLMHELVECAVYSGLDPPAVIEELISDWLSWVNKLAA